MMHFSLQQYIEISVLIYLTRLVADKLFLSTKFIRNFYYDRMIYPSIRVWKRRSYKILIDEIFALVEVFIINISYMVVYWSLPFSSVRNAFVFMFFVFLFTIIVKSRFVATEVSYPKLLFILDIVRVIMAYTLHSVILAMFYNPLNTMFHNI